MLIASLVSQKGRGPCRASSDWSVCEIGRWGREETDRLCSFVRFLRWFDVHL